MIYVDVDGDPQGPFSADELSALWGAGEIDPSARYWYRGMPGWLPVANFMRPPQEPRAPASQVELTTAPTFARRSIERELAIVTAEGGAVLNTAKDFFSAFLGTGAPSETMQSALRRARLACLAELQREAQTYGADGVIGVTLRYSELGGQGSVTLLLVATGTAVRLGPPPVLI